MLSPLEHETAMSSHGRVLRRSLGDRWIGGVCGGLGVYLGIDSTAVRVGYVLLSILSIAFPGILVYIILWILIPECDYD